METQAGYTATHNAAQSTHTRPASDPLIGMAQVNIKINKTTKIEFDIALKKRGEGQREVIERIIECYIHGVENRAVMHLDGQLCPLSQLILDLTKAARMQFELTNKFAGMSDREIEQANRAEQIAADLAKKQLKMPGV